jgi:cobyrinic acid a,c-diamide synthase
MSCLPRLAIGTIHPSAESQGILWALLDVLCRAGLNVQTFLSRACFPRYQAAAAITGLCTRHLDSWLMSPNTCRELFLRGMQSADLAIVEGHYAADDEGRQAGGQLTPLCEWLDLPRLVVLDASRLSPCRMPRRPAAIDGLLVYGAQNRSHLMQTVTELESLWGVPVLGGFETTPSLQPVIESTMRGDRDARELCRGLGDRLAQFWNPRQLLDIACKREIPKHWFRNVEKVQIGRALRIAIAYDDAFHSYFPDTLDLLERRGASIVDFSPLHDEALPPQTDVVYFGCGHPERYAAALADNHCMKVALRGHLCAGRRIYGEGGGAAYLCQHLETPDGQLKRMVGLLPAVARLAHSPAAMRPEEISFARSTWLGGKGLRLRGYHSPQWRFEPVDQCQPLVAEPDHQYDMIGNLQAVGSLLHFDFCAEPAWLDRFFFPELPDNSCNV